MIQSQLQANMRYFEFSQEIGDVAYWSICNKFKIIIYDFIFIFKKVGYFISHTLSSNNVAREREGRERRIPILAKQSSVTSSRWRISSGTNDDVIDSGLQLNLAFGFQKSSVVISYSIDKLFEPIMNSRVGLAVLSRKGMYI